MNLSLALIVEGHGETEAAPVLLRRITDVLRPDISLNVLSPLRIGRYKLVKTNEVERAVEYVSRRMEPPRAILILIDAEDDCPAEVGPKLLCRAMAARPDVPVGVVLAKREFEAWFLAALESLCGCRGLLPELPPVAQPEDIRDAKGRLTQFMKGTRVYSPVVDQSALAAQFDLDLARRRSDSFEKLWREAGRLLNTPGSVRP